MRKERRDAGRQGRVRFRPRIHSPRHGRVRCDRRIEVVAQRGGERHLVSRLDLDLVEHRRQAAVAGRREQLGQRLDLGLELAGRKTGLGGSLALGFGVGGRGLHGFLCRQRLALDAGDLGHQLLAALGGGLELGGVGGAADDLAGLGIERGELALELGDLLLALAPLRLQALPARAGLGRGNGELAQARLGTFEGGFRLIVGGKRLLLEVAGQAGRVGERDGLRLEARDGLLGFGDQRLLARHVAAELLDAGLELLLPVGGALRLALQILLLDLEAGEDGALGRFLIAQRLQLAGGFGLGSDRLGLGLGGAPHLLQRRGEIGFPGIDLALRIRPLQVEDDGLELADLGRDLLVAPRLAGLPLQALDLRVELAQDVVEAGEIAFGGAQPQLRLVAAAVQAGDAGGVLQDAPALLGLGVDQLADLPLAHQRRRAGARGCVLEQDAHRGRAPRGR